MYNLNYSYIHNLDIDTSTSFRDISALALFIGTQSNDFYTPLSSVTNKFVEWFFGVDNSLKSEIDVTLKYAYFNISSTATATTDPNAIIPYSELTAKLAPRLELIKESLLTLLEETRDALNPDSTMPFGTVVINDDIPEYSADVDTVPGEWDKYDKRFIKEASGVDGGFTGPCGPADALLADTGAPLSSILATITNMPEHYHEVELTPNQNSGVGTIEAEGSGNQKFSQPSRPYAIAVATTGHVTDYKAAYVSTGYSGDAFGKDKLLPYVKACKAAYANTFKISPAGPAGNVYKQINPVPKPYSLTQKAISATETEPQVPEISPAIFVKTKITSS